MSISRPESQRSGSRNWRCQSLKPEWYVYTRFHLWLLTADQSQMWRLHTLFLSLERGLKPGHTYSSGLVCRTSSSFWYSLPGFLLLGELGIKIIKRSSKVSILALLVTFKHQFCPGSLNALSVPLVISLKLFFLQSLCSRKYTGNFFTESDNTCKCPLGHQTS